jgi:hypothetical protein
MIRKTIISGVLAAGAFAGMVFEPSSADAAPPVIGPAYSYGPNTGPFPPRGHDHGRDHDWHNRAKFQVIVRHHGHWDVVETFRDRDDARRLAYRLERQGQDAEVRMTR